MHNYCNDEDPYIDEDESDFFGHQKTFMNEEDHKEDERIRSFI